MKGEKPKWQQRHLTIQHKDVCPCISTFFCHINYEYTNKGTRRAKVTLQAIKRNKTASTIVAGLSDAIQTDCGAQTKSMYMYRKNFKLKNCTRAASFLFNI